MDHLRRAVNSIPDKLAEVDPLLKRDIDTGKYTRIMNAYEIKLRDELNVANTASALRRRVTVELAKKNGHSVTV